MYSKILFKDCSNIMNDDLYEKLENEEITLDDIIKNEIENLKKQDVIFISDLVIKTPNFKVKCLELDFTLEDCDEKGFLLSRQKENLLENTSKIKNAKCKIIVEYFKSKNIKYKILTKYDSNIISFQPPYGKEHSYNHSNINCFNFKIGSLSSEDKQNEIWIKESEKITKKLQEIWKNSQEKKTLVYNYNSDYLEPIIKEKFPAIIKQKHTNLLFKYNGSYYQELIETNDHSELTKLIQDNMFNDNNDLINLKQLAETIKYITQTYNFKIKDFEKCYLYNCKNGILNLITGELMEHSPRYFFNYCSDIEYNKNADNSKLEQFIKSVVTEENPIELISKIIAHVHFQKTKLQKGFLFVGTSRGRNGKGTLVKLIRQVIGCKRTVTMPLTRFHDSPFNEYKLKDKALYIEDDYKAEYIDQKTIGLLNSMITMVETTVADKNKSGIDIKYTSVPLVQCNKLPKLKADDDGGFYDRWVQIHFNNEFGDKMNEFLSDELLNDKNVMSSTLNLLIKGYNLILERKKISKVGSFFKEDENNQNWKIKNNQVLEFVNECCVIGGNYKCSTRDLYNYYKNDWNLGGFKISETKFVRLLKEGLHLETKRIRINNKQQTMIYGITCDDLLNLENIKSEV